MEIAWSCRRFEFSSQQSRITVTANRGTLMTRRYIYIPPYSLQVQKILWVKNTIKDAEFQRAAHPIVKRQITRVKRVW